MAVFAEIKITPSQTDAGAGITQPIFPLVLSISQTTFHKWGFLLRLITAENIYKSPARTLSKHVFQSFVSFVIVGSYSRPQFFSDSRLHGSASQLCPLLMQYRTGMDKQGFFYEQGIGVSKSFL